jgi:hypothetical protein
VKRIPIVGRDAYRVQCDHCQPFIIDLIVPQEWTRLREEQPGYWKKLQAGLVAYIKHYTQDRQATPKLEIYDWEMKAKKGGV